MRSLISLIRRLMGQQNTQKLRAPLHPAQAARTDSEAITVRIRRPRAQHPPDALVAAAAVEAATEAIFWTS